VSATLSRASRSLPIPSGEHSLESELARRLERLIARVGPECRWKAAERAEWAERIEAAVGTSSRRAQGVARHLEKLAGEVKGSALAREARRVAALIRIHAESRRTASARVCLSQVIAALRQAFEFEQATAFVCHGGADRLEPVVVEGSLIDLIPDILFDHGAGFSSWVAKTRRPVLLSAFREDPMSAVGDRPASFLSVPLLAGEELLAVLNFAHRRPGTFTIGDRDLVLFAGRLAAPALARLRVETPRPIPGIGPAPSAAAL
jgi:transcriptional regulator with GAF, ATPase, and Fis domain